AASGAAQTISYATNNPQAPFTHIEPEPEPQTGGTGNKPPVVPPVIPPAPFPSNQPTNTPSSQPGNSTGGPGSPEALQQTLKLDSTENNLQHIFNNASHDHGLDSLISTYGSQEKAFAAIVNSMQGKTFPASGDFSIKSTVSGVTVTIRGTIIDGIARIGTVFA
ncbi:MAG: hypothetical protein FWF43_09295, partial [Propionibacteriaceae bacterium]|nr:hypothetical protein [Propionibacteriaceae bacterium]